MAAAVAKVDKIAEIAAAAPDITLPDIGKIGPDLAETVDRVALARATEHQRAAVIGELGDAAVTAALAALHDVRGQILDAMRPQVAEAGRVLSDAARHVTPDELARDADQILRVGGPAAAAVPAIVESTAALDRLRAARLAIGDRAGIYAGGWVDTYAGLHWLRQDADSAFRSDQRWHRLVDLGLSIQLRDESEVKQLDAETPQRSTMRSAEDWRRIREVRARWLASSNAAA